jgi:hypothetical protein
MVVSPFTASTLPDPTKHGVTKVFRYSSERGLVHRILMSLISLGRDLVLPLELHLRADPVVFLPYRV